MPNRLAASSSPYLRQHADNPVDWWEWGPDALAAAKSSNRPILLSVGYATCHWCHVMAHESFEDADIAHQMNRDFVCIKVDREQRPDLDKIYQLAHQALSQQSGGWPLTVFLTPDDQLPFFSGTYFPPAARHGLPAFNQVLAGIAQSWREQPQQVRKQNQAMAEFLRDYATTEDTEMVSATTLNSALVQAQQSFDTRHGGFGGAPKFPQAPLLRWLAEDDRPAARQMWRDTMGAMAAGGLQDHIGGGFCRYCVDEDWTIPHFEKMLYDNAQLLPLYAGVADDWAVQAERGIMSWLETLQSPQGAYYSAQDADSEGEEGKYYVWQPEQIKAIVDAEHYPQLAEYFGLDRAPNFEGKAWYPRIYGAWPESEQETLQSLKAQLLQARNQREAPIIDSKILTGMNALMASGFADAARLRDNAEYGDFALLLLRYLQQHHFDGQRLSGSDANTPAFLDDYAFVLDAIWATLQWRWDDALLAFARALADTLLQQFTGDAGFFFTASDHETLIQRPLGWFDDATPNGNATAGLALLRFSHLVGEVRYQDAAQAVLKGGATAMQRQTLACATLLRLRREWEAPAAIWWVVGRETAQWITRTDRIRNAVFFVDKPGNGLPALLQQRKTPGVYICSGMACQPVITEALALDSIRDQAD